jgi:predicted nucleic acid-binding protein
MSKAFLDTNVLVYASDMDRPAKRDTARTLMQQISHDIPPCISTQVIQEFYVSTTRKLGIDPLKAKDIIHSFRHMEIVTIDIHDINRAIEGNILWQVSFWDALIVVAAQKARCDVLYTEDLNHGQIFDALKVCNPFR